MASFKKELFVFDFKVKIKQQLELARWVQQLRIFTTVKSSKTTFGHK